MEEQRLDLNALKIPWQLMRVNETAESVLSFSMPEAQGSPLAVPWAHPHSLCHTPSLAEFKSWAREGKESKREGDEKTETQEQDGGTLLAPHAFTFTKPAVSQNKR